MNYDKMTTKQLLEIYNDHAETKVKKFTNKPTAIRRLTALLKDCKCAKCKPVTKKKKPAAKSGAARKTKAAVIVTHPDGTVEQFSSCHAAFAALPLLYSRHEKFRKKLKIEGENSMDGYHFKATYKD